MDIITPRFLTYTRCPVTRGVASRARRGVHHGFTVLTAGRPGAWAGPAGLRRRVAATVAVEVGEQLHTGWLWPGALRACVCVGGVVQ